MAEPDSGGFGPQGSKMRFFKFYKKSVHGIFLIFFMKLQHEVLKVDLDVFYGKNLVLKFSNQKRFFKLYEQFTHNFSDFLLNFLRNVSKVY